MADKRLSHLQRRILSWLAAEEQRTRHTMSGSHQDLVRTLATDKGNLSRSVHNLEAKGLIHVGRTPGGKAEYLDLTADGRILSSQLAGSC
jgi:DNA-binding MarR family transcriptional regulator